MDVGGLLTVVVAALAILGAAGSAWAFLADRGNKERLNGLRDDISDRNVRIKFLEDENTRHERETVEKDKIIVRLQSEMASMTRYMDAQAGPLKMIADHLTLVGQQLQAHHEVATGGFAMVETQNADILRILGDRRHVPPENITRALDHE